MNDLDRLPNPSAEELLRLAKLASGGERWDGVRALRLQGEIRLGGLSGNVEQTLLLGNGVSLLRYTLGPVEQRHGFDGGQAWTMSASGEVIMQDSEAARSAAAADAYVDARAWWYPDRRTARMGEVSLILSAGKRYWAVAIFPEPGQPIELWIDAATYLIDRIIRSPGTATQRTQRWLDYRKIDGALIAHRFESWKGGDTTHLLTLDFARVEINPALDARVCAAPDEALNDFEFIDGGGEATFQFKLFNNHIYIDASINGQSLELMLDTGGANLLTPEAAARAGIVSQGALKAEGPGKGGAQAGLAKVPSVLVGGRIALKEQVFRIVPLPGFDEVEGTRFDGLIGFELFKRCVVRIDYANQLLSCMPAARFSGADAGTALVLRFSRTTPVVDGMVDGIPVHLEVDTGSRAALTLWASLTREHDLIARYSASGETAIGWGVGGVALGHVARAGELQLGGLSLQGPIAALVTEAGAASSRLDIDGNLGGEILRRFTVTFDYRNKKLYLQPNHHFDEAMDYDRSGMWINRGSGGIVVASLLPGGPAEQAGLRVGDLIAEIDGLRSSDLLLSDLRRKLRSDPVGTRVRLLRKTPEADEWVVLELRDLVPPG